MIVDVNVNYGFWPFRKFNQRVETLAKEGIDYIFLSHLGSVFYFQDPDIYNKELREKFKNKNNFFIISTINPTIPGWEEIIEENNFTAVKIIPGYHLFSLLDKKIYPFFRKISDKNIPLIIQMRFEDERNLYPLLKLPKVKIEEIEQIALNFPEIKIVVFCPYFFEAVKLGKIENVYIEISFVEKFKTISSLVKEIPSDKIIFGSHTPFLYPQAAISKVKYAEISEEEKEKIYFKNAAKIFSLNF